MKRSAPKLEQPILKRHKPAPHTDQLPICEKKWINETKVSTTFGIDQEVSCQVCQDTVAEVQEKPGNALLYVCGMSHINCSDCSIKILLQQICPCAVAGSVASQNIWGRGEVPNLWFATLYEAAKPMHMLQNLERRINFCKVWIKKISQEKKFGQDLFPADYKLVSSTPVIDLVDDDVELAFGKFLSCIKQVEPSLGSKKLSRLICGPCIKDENVGEWCRGIKTLDPKLWPESRARFLNITERDRGVSIPCVFGGSHEIKLGVGFKDMGTLTFDTVLQRILEHALTPGECMVKTFCNVCDYEFGCLPDDFTFSGVDQLLRHMMKKHHG